MNIEIVPERFISPKLIFFLSIWRTQKIAEHNNNFLRQNTLLSTFHSYNFSCLAPTVDEDEDSDDKKLSAVVYTVGHSIYRAKVLERHGSGVAQR